MTRVLAFVDESGDTGRPGFGGSSLLVVGMAVFHDVGEASRCEGAIAELRANIGKPSGYEFPFRTNSDAVRRAFRTTVTRCGFTYYAVVLEKGQDQRTVGLDLYLAACVRLCGLAGRALDRATLVADEVTGSRHGNRQLATRLRNQVNAAAGREVLSKIKVQDSARNSLLQLADYVAGVVGRSAREDAKPGTEAYARLLRAQKGEVWRGPA